MILSQKPEDYKANDYYNPPMLVAEDEQQLSSNFGSGQINGRALSHQIQTNVPRYLRESAFRKGFVDLLYFANSLAGTHTAEVDINMPFMPQVLIWRLGATDKNGDVLDANGGMVMSACDLAVGGTCAIEWDKDAITFTASTLNVGWPTYIEEHFYYMVFNDDAKLSDFGI